MRYRHLVTIMQPTEVRSAKAAVSHTWAPLHSSVPATITATTVQETRASDMAVEEGRYDIVLAGRYVDVTTAMAVQDSEGRQFEIDFIDAAFNKRQTRLAARIVSTPA
jgi:uncharacterized protein YaiI (UPF0178 family)